MRKIVFIVLALIILAIIFTRFFKTCDFEGGWGRGKTQHCDCKGIKITVDNNGSVDGNYQTVCVGLSSPK